MEGTSVKAPGNFKDLLVWQRGMALAQRIHALTRNFPPDKRFGLVAQMRRTAVSIASNLAEGQARHTTGEFIQFISDGEGSLAELETQLRLGLSLGFCSRVLELMEELRKMLERPSPQTGGTLRIDSAGHSSLVIYCYSCSTTFFMPCAASSGTGGLPSQR